MMKIIDSFKKVLEVYYKGCGYVVFGFEWLFKKIFTFVKMIIKFVGSFLYKYIIKYILIGVVWSYNHSLRYGVRFIYKILVPKHKRGRGLSMEQKKALSGYMFISPLIIGLLGLVFYPFGRIVYMSFNNVIQYQTDFTFQYVGLENFRRILQIDIDFVLQVQDFIVRVILYTPVIITLAIIVAMLLNQNIRGKGIFRMIFFLPIIILNGALLSNMSDYGGMDITLSFFVIDIINTIVPEFAVSLFVELFGIIIEILWYTGVPILIFLAMLQKVDKSLYEAASIDGANSWSMFWKITLPIISPAITVSIIFIVVFLGNFDGNPINSLINTARTRADRREGYASAMALIYSFVQIAVISLLLFISSKNIRDTLLGKNRKKKLIPKSQQIKVNKGGVS